MGRRNDERQFAQNLQQSVLPGGGVDLRAEGLKKLAKQQQINQVTLSLATNIFIQRFAHNHLGQEDLTVDQLNILCLEAATSHVKFMGLQAELLNKEIEDGLAKNP